MVTVLPVAGPWNQLANACFLLSALVSDLLILRLFLFAAYLCLFAAALTGYPRWFYWGWQDRISADGLAWSSVIILLHGYAIWRHSWDERPISFKSDDEEQLWRFFYRRSGMCRLEMHECLKFGGWRRYSAGESIVHPATSHTKLHVLVEGVVDISYPGRTALGATPDGGQLYSGMLFDLGVANIFGVYFGFDCSTNREFAAHAKTDCLLYEWSTADLEVMTKQLAPSVTSFWRSFLLCEVGLEYAMRCRGGAAYATAADGVSEIAVFLDGARSRDFTDPMREDELPPRRTFKTILRGFLGIWDPFPPAGLRRAAQPLHGITARKRLMALNDARVAGERARSIAFPPGKPSPADLFKAQTDAGSGLAAAEEP